VYEGLATAPICGSLLVAAWCFLAGARNRWINMSHVAGLALVEAALLVQAGVAVVRIAGGERPEELATFLGYLVTSVLLLPLAVVLSFMERTRWGAVITGAGGLVSAVVTLRLLQVWTPLHG
jgi:predicted membrane protein